MSDKTLWCWLAGIGSTAAVVGGIALTVAFPPAAAMTGPAICAMIGGGALAGAGITGTVNTI